MGHGYSLWSGAVLLMLPVISEAETEPDSGFMAIPSDYQRFSYTDGAWSNGDVRKKLFQWLKEPQSEVSSQFSGKRSNRIYFIDKPWVDYLPILGKGPFDPKVPKEIAPSPNGNSGEGGNGGTITFDDDRDEERDKNKNKGDAYPYWYPMCLFMDPNAVSESQGNSTVKQLVDEAARCSVNLVVFPVTVKPESYPRSAGGANALQSHACNIPGNLDNATRASTSICVDSTMMADEMCGSTSGSVAGCASLQSGGGGGLTPSQLEGLAAHLGGKISFAKGGEAAPSIEDIGACNGGTVGHEALGHSMWGHPNGGSDGNGIGIGPGGGGGSGWTGGGCAAMKRSAFLNEDGKYIYDPDRKVYYTREKDPETWWDLLSGRQLFNDKSGASQASSGGGASSQGSRGGGTEGSRGSGSGNSNDGSYYHASKLESAIDLAGRDVPSGKKTSLESEKVAHDASGRTPLKRSLSFIENEQSAKSDARVMKDQNYSGRRRYETPH